MTTSQQNENTLTSAISNEIADNSIDLSLDYSELVLDSFLADGVLKEIPFIKTIYAVGKIGVSIKERFFVKKLFVFLKEFHNQSIDTQKLNQFRSKFNSEEKYRNNVTEQIMIYLDTFLTLEKSKILAKLFKAHVDGNIDWEYFNHLSICLDSISPKAFPFLQQLSNHGFKIAEDKASQGIPRDGESEALLYACGVAYQTSSWSSGFNVSQLGKDLYNFGMR
ncbi:hypothetical protein [Flavobacterium salmonis]|uniref:Uncharacterized protein n=1 Tax=Flavobacterium salmonis TaxID=2654844 RepID=A0A6V6Z7P2_9FLAO|nr:hypothetical protein [Flavobacterium salmonis]CAD0007813.1 hypothetical protein FLAT13_04049 [Flavobacterium salmonis]